MHTYMRLYIGVRRLVRHSVAGQHGRYVCPAADPRGKARERGLLTTFFHASVQGISVRRTAPPSAATRATAQ